MAFLVKRSIAVLFVSVLTGVTGKISRSMAAPGSPESPDRPGRATPDQAGQPNIGPVPTQPSTQPVEAPAMSDDDLLKKTQEVMQLPSHPDRDLLRWYGYRATLESDGISFAGALSLDYSHNAHGGITSGDDFRNLLDLRLSLDTKPLLGLTGGLFSIDFQNQAGGNATERLTGDVQGFDNADADGRTQIAELWYQQLFFEQKLRIKVGKVDSNSEFSVPLNDVSFLNSSYGHSPTILAMPTYPNPAMSINAFIYPTPNFYAGAGIYDGSGAVSVNTGSYGPKHFFTSPGDYFFIGEVGSQWSFAQYTLPGRIAVGGWGSNARFGRNDGGTEKGTGGIYLNADQTIWHKLYYNPTDPQGVGIFFQFGQADNELAAVNEYYSTGFTWTGMIPTRIADVTGLGVNYANLSDDPQAGFIHSAESSVELFYGLQFTPYCQIKPDLQYIMNPGGTTSHDALVATVRLTLAF